MLVFGASGPRFWSRKTGDFRRFFEFLPSLFRDAMETAKTSAEVSGPQRFAIVSLVIQRIRSALSVDPPLVALILKVSPSTLNVSRMFLIYVPKILQKSYPNPKRAPSASRKRLLFDVFEFLVIFWGPGPSQNRPKIDKIRNKKT